MTAPDGKIRIPLNEEASKSTGQIEEFLMKYNGEGIQHIALLTDDLFASVDSLKRAGVPLMAAPPATDYKMLEERLPGHGENASELQVRGILLDGATTGAGPSQASEPPRGADAGGVLGAPSDGKRRLLLQIFSQLMLGPVFFEFIQRKGDEGFGEGNFKALFESLERDQLERGVIQAA
jgi:4-hydroxyphenylpyruvate dioxygenase